MEQMYITLDTPYYVLQPREKFLLPVDFDEEEMILVSPSKEFIETGLSCINSVISCMSSKYLYLHNVSFKPITLVEDFVAYDEEMKAFYKEEKESYAKMFEMDLPIETEGRMEFPEYDDWLTSKTTIVDLSKAAIHIKRI